MTSNTKYIVFDLDKMFEMKKSLENWLNDMYESGYELVAIRNNEFIFKNRYYSTTKQVEDFFEG